MGSKLYTSFRSDGIYNMGGITGIWLLYADDFVAYRFADDTLYSSGYVTDIIRNGQFIGLGHENESHLSETFSDGVYKQELKSFIRVVDRRSINWLMQAHNNRFVVVACTCQGAALTFGSDGGAKLSYSIQSGQTGDINGISLKLEKTSVYPILEVNPESIKTKVLSSEVFNYICAETTNNLIEIL